MTAQPTTAPLARGRAIGLALLVTLLWSTSWVLIKLGLDRIPALTFAGLRYSLAFICLLPFALTPANRAAIRRLSAREWWLLGLLGLVYYAISQGAQFLSLVYLPAVTVSLVLNLTVLVVVFSGISLLDEKLSPRQWVGVGIFLLGLAVYFYPVSFPARQWLGLGLALVCMLSSAGGAVLGRYINRSGTISPLIVTVTSMGIGSILMLAGGVLSQGMPSLTWEDVGLVTWMAVVNTAVAFTLWNQTLTVLTATESSLLNNTMLVQIALLAWIFLGEAISLRAGAGLLLVMLGVLLVQLSSPLPPARRSSEPAQPA